MATTIKIKRSTGTSAPSSLVAGELAYTGGAGVQGGSGSRLFVGNPADGANLVIGGKYFTDMLDHVHGTNTASSALIVDSSKKINEILSGNIVITGSTDTISTSSGALTIAPTGSLVITHGGTIDLSGQANSVTLLDNSATAIDFNEAGTSYLTIVTTNGGEKVVIGQDTTFADDISLISDSAIINFGADNDVSLTHVADIGLLLNGASEFQFRDSALSIGSSADGQLDIEADTELEITAPTVEFNTDSQILAFGADGDVTLTHIADTGLLLNTSSQIQFRDSDLNISSPSDGTLAIAADSEVDITATTIDINGNADVSGTFGAGETTVSSLTVSDLTNNRVVIAGTSGAVEDDANFTFDGTTLALTAGMDITGDLDVDNININANTISSTDTNGDITLSPNGTGTVKVPSGYDDRSGQDSLTLVTKGYVDAVKQSLDIKDSVRVASTGNVSLTSGSSDLEAGDTIDGVTLVAGDRVLLKNQSTASENGIYVAVASGGTPARSDDANASAEVTSGMFVWVEEGTSNGDQGYVLTTNNVITLNTTDLTFTQFSGAGQITAGDGLTKSGNTINIVPDNVTLSVTADEIKLKGDVTTTALGDLLIGKATDGGYKRLAVSSGGANYLLQINASGTDLEYTNTLDGGTF